MMIEDSLVGKTIRYALEPGVRKRAAAVAVVVGSILNIINQGDKLIDGRPLDWIKIILTYMVPYCVATYGAVSYRLSLDKNSESANQ